MALPYVFDKSFFVIIAFAFASNYFYNYHYGKRRKPEKKEIHEVIMFSRDREVFRKSKFSRCAITQSMDRLLFYLSSSRHTLDICMFVLTNMDLANAMMKLHYRGVIIRIIIDADMAYLSNSTIKRFEKQGIPVRWMKSSNLMHHKFCLIDSSSEETQAIPLLMTGSLNWTNQALSGNWENVMVTSQRELVSQYKVEYERLWNLFKPVVGLNN